MEWFDVFNEQIQQGTILEGTGCWDSSERILAQIKGTRYWIPNLGHFYVVPKDSALDSFALNQKDTGYSQYPRLTNGEVIELGHTHFG